MNGSVTNAAVFPGTSPEDSPPLAEATADLKFKQPTFTFVRVRYSTARGYRSWATDYPDADVNFSAQFQRVTGLASDPHGRVMSLP